MKKTTLTTILLLLGGCHCGTRELDSSEQPKLDIGLPIQQHDAGDEDAGRYSGSETFSRLSPHSQR